ncbi:hypothetical protein EDD11_001449 [Mortierella claussenii]|nr:hypothetical protein EDD11_001449 [Mortierella claussenii]
MAKGLSSLDIPHIRDRICLDLSLQDTAHCVLVSKDWSIFFTPALWAHVHLDLYNHPVKTLQLLASLQTLRTLSVSQANGKNGPLTKELTKTLQSLSGLHELHLTVNDYIPQALQKLLAVCPGCESIRLDLRLRNDIGEEDNEWSDRHRPSRSKPESLEIQHIRQLMTWDTGHDNDDDEDTIKVNTDDVFRVREFRVQFDDDEITPHVLSPFLEKCSLLEELAIHGLSQYSCVKYVIGMLRGNLLPRLKRLDLNVADSGTSLEDQTCELLQLAGHDHGGNHDNSGLESLFMASNDPFTQRCLDPLVRHHFQVLTHLLIDGHLALDAFMSLVTNLGHLESLSVRVLPYMISEESGLLVNAATYLSFEQQTWKSAGSLRRFELRLDPDENLDLWFESSEWNPCLLYRGLKVLFLGLSRLTLLEELKIHMESTNVLKLSNDFLQQLSGLKRMRLLGCYQSFSPELGKDEAEWMLQHWPRLTEVRQSRVQEAFRKRMMDARPWIQITEMAR